jgi:glucosamine--fructose-6-phosphate aminotransferase (isomerizing)
MLACHKLPLLVGVGGDTLAVSSQETPLRYICETYGVVPEEEVFVLEVAGGKAKIVDTSGEDQLRALVKFKLEPPPVSVLNEQFRCWTEQEIGEQVRILHNNKFILPAQVKHQLQTARKFVFVACGSSRYATMIAGFNWPSVECLEASELNTHVVYSADVCYVFVSQSGETLDVLRICRHLKNTHSCFGITNCHNSQLTREVPCVILNAGRERGVAATKSYTAQLNTIWAMGAVIYQSPVPLQGVLSENQLKHIWDLTRVIGTEIHLVNPTNSLFLLGSNSMYPISLEGALKLKELSYYHAEAFHTGALKHGPLALVEPGLFVFIVNIDGENKRVSHATSEITARGGRVVVLSGRHETAPKANTSTQVIHLSQSDSVENRVIWVTVFFQCLAVNLAHKRGIDPDMPRNLAKTVTVE